MWKKRTQTLVLRVFFTKFYAVCVNELSANTITSTLCVVYVSKLSAKHNTSTSKGFWNVMCIWEKWFPVSSQRMMGYCFIWPGSRYADGDILSKLPLNWCLPSQFQMVIFDYLALEISVWTYLYYKVNTKGFVIFYILSITREIFSISVTLPIAWISSLVLIGVTYESTSAWRYLKLWTYAYAWSFQENFHYAVIELNFCLVSSFAYGLLRKVGVYLIALFPSYSCFEFKNHPAIRVLAAKINTSKHFLTYACC